MFALFAAALLTRIAPCMDGVTLPFGLHSYRRLAEELTAQGITVHCNPAVQHRYALIRVPARPWTTLRPLLESALGIRFADVGDGSLEIEKDPEQAALEAALLRRLSRMYSQNVQDAVQRGWEAYYRMATEAPRRDGVDALANAYDSIRSLPVGNPDRNALSVAMSLRDEARHRYVFADLWNGIDLVGLMKGVVPTLESSDQVAAFAAPDNPIGSIEAPPMNSFGIRLPDGEQSLAPIMVDTWRFESRTLSLTRAVTACPDISQQGFGMGVVDTIPDVIGFECRWDDLYKGMPAKAKFLERTKETAAWLKSKEAAQPVDTPPVGPSVSGIFDEWSAAVGQPVIMEVLPNRDNLANWIIPRAKGLTIPSFLAGKVQENIHPSFLGSAWTIGQFDDVTVVRDEAAFMDHLVASDPEAAIALRTAREKSPSGVNTVDDLVAASSLLSPEEGAIAADNFAYGDMSQFIFACPYLTLLQSDPASLEQLRELKSGRRFSVPLSKFSAKARKSFARWLRVLAPRMPTLWSSALWPDFDQVLANASVEVAGDPWAGQQVLRLSLTTPTMNVQPWGICSAAINPITLRE